MLNLESKSLRVRGGGTASNMLLPNLLLTMEAKTPVVSFFFFFFGQLAKSISSGIQHSLVNDGFRLLLLIHFNL